MLNRHLALALCLCATLCTSALAAPPVRKAAPVAAARTPAAPQLPEPTLGQLEAAGMVLLGESNCDERHLLAVQPLAGHDGYLDVAYRKLRFVMKPVLSSTGAIRLEDVQGRALLLQIAYKSMLMDTRAGQRLADNCVHHAQASAQRAAEEAAAAAAAADVEATTTAKPAAITTQPG